MVFNRLESMQFCGAHYAASATTSGQITLRKVDGWQTLPDKLIPQCIDLAA
jgi:hypothetical protein